MGVWKCILAIFILYFSGVECGDIFSSGIQIQNCSISHLERNLKRKMLEYVDSGKKLIFISISFADDELPIPENYTGEVYKPLEWVRTYGRHGRSLLFLRPQFEHLSLTTLSYETARMSITITQTPSKCLSKHNVSTIEKNVRRLLVLDSKMSEKEKGIVENEYICNVHIHNAYSRVIFRYVCCHDHERTMEHLHCDEMKYDFWMELLFLCVFLIKILVIMFCPLLIPDSLYRMKYAEADYEHRLSKPIEIKVIKITESDRPATNPAVKIDQIKRMKTFYSTIKNAPFNKVLKLTLDKIIIKVRHDRLVPPNYVPVGILQIFYTMFVKCHIRKVQPFTECCRGSLFGKGLKLGGKTSQTTNSKQGTEENAHGHDDGVGNGHHKCEHSDPKHPWYKCLRQFIRFVLLCCMSIPWIIRMLFYYEFEQTEAIDQRHAAEKRALTLPALEWNLTYTLSPIHTIFLICYAVILIDVVVFGVVSSTIKKKLQFLMRKSLRDMREMSRSKAIQWSAAILILPFEVCGIFGFIVFVPYLVIVMPVVVIILAFYCLPTVNLILRLLGHFFTFLIPLSCSCCGRQVKISANKKIRALFNFFHLNVLSDTYVCLKKTHAISFKNRFLQLLVLLACMLTVFSLVLLTMETLIFFIEMILYTIIGIIMNTTEMLKYISLIFMLGLYARDCFKGVTDKYLVFNKTINNLMVEMNRSKVEAIAKESADDQRNTAFQICSHNHCHVENEKKKDAENVKLITKGGILKWNVRRLILFLDKYDEPYITEKFFFSTCYMDTVGVPGPLVRNMAQAMWRFLCIFAFLMFVVLIVLAFGEEYNISGTNQMLATLAGGFLPWVFSNILFKPRDPVPLDVENLSFKSNFKIKIDEYEQNWDIADIDIDKREITSKDEDGAPDIPEIGQNMTTSTDESVHEEFPTLLSNSSSLLFSECNHVVQSNADCDIDLVILEKTRNGPCNV